MTMTLFSMEKEKKKTAMTLIVEIAKQIDFKMMSSKNVMENSG